MDKKEYVIQKKSRNKQEEEVETPKLNGLFKFIQSKFNSFFHERLHN